jgi:hypothetical protein
VGARELPNRIAGAHRVQRQPGAGDSRGALRDS